jgi:very-short-patch-repair endonuclease
MHATSELCALAADVAARQHHLVTRGQLHVVGVSEKQIHDWQRTRFLHRVEPNVFLVAGGRLTWRARLLSVCLTTEGLASHRSSAALHALEGCNPGRPEITLPRGQLFRRTGVRTHESTDLHLTRCVIVDGIPCTPVARTLLDLGAVAPSLVEDATIDAATRRLATWPELLSTLVTHSRRGRRGCGPLRAVLDEHYGEGMESKLERRFDHLLRDAGLPLPIEQYRVYDEVGFIMRVDFAYPDLLLAIEVDSVEHHLTRKAFEEDRIKRNRVRRAGWHLIEVTSKQMRTRPTRVCEELALVIRQRSAFLRP